MPKQISTEEFDTLLQVISGFPSGVSLREINTRLKIRLPLRTLQRRLASLVSQGRLHILGQGRSSRYQIPLKKDSRPSGLIQTKPSRIPLSGDAEDIKKMVCRPVMERVPVGYNRDFLDGYHPGRTYYLPPDMRQHLHDQALSREEVHPAGTYIRRIFDRLLIDLSWNSSRLEGNTYSLLETERLLEMGEAAQGKNVRETQMILNHKAAIELLVNQAEEIGFNSYTILNLHALLADNLLEDSRACGRLRSIPVGIGGSVFHPLEIPQLIQECFQQVLYKAGAIDDPFEQSFFALVHLSYLQPFEDVNKRVSRLAANIPFIRQNLSPVSFLDVPEQEYIEGVLGVYELNRIELLRDVFVWAYERSCARYSAVRQSLGKPDPFRLKYRELIAETVRGIVPEITDKKVAVAFIKQQTEQKIPMKDQARFIEAVETEIMNLHEGNIARYSLKPSQYLVWREKWH